MLAEGNEVYNDGGAFKLVCRGKDGVIVTILADNYYGGADPFTSLHRAGIAKRNMQRDERSGFCVTQLGSSAALATLSSRAEANAA